MNFRHDINGLRAIAVIAVVLFHFNSQWLPGGFAGVDVFFVISGFLMTSIIFRGLENDTFSLQKFYIARANRIIPALAVLCLFLLLGGFLLLTPINYYDLGKHAASSLSFISNIIYWQEIDYFDVSSHEKWLLHTWSLSVEWQFYILYPVALLLLKKVVSLEALKRIIILGTVLGFGFSVYSTIQWPSASYYLLTTRAWEMMIGGVAFLYPLKLSDMNKKVAEMTGLLLIACSYFFISSNDPWPGHLALFPVLGAMLVILSNRSDSFITNNRLFQSIGSWSYSIYLWHWPVVVFIYHYTPGENLILGMALSVVFGMLSHNYVEKKNLIFKEFSFSKALPLSISVFTLVFAISTQMTNGFENRISPDYRMTKKQFRDQFEGHAGLYERDGGVVYINADKNKFDYILIGDSYARHYNSFFLDYDLAVASLAIDGCASTLRYWQHYKSSNICRERYQFTLDFVRSNPGKTIIISQSWPHVSDRSFVRDSVASSDSEKGKDKRFLDELNALIQDINTDSKSIYVLGQNQTSSIIPITYLAESDLPLYAMTRISSDSYKEHFEQNKWNDLLLENASSGSYIFIDPSPALCEKNQCFKIKNKVPVYTDHGHLSKFGANIVGTYFMDIISKGN